MTAAPLRIAIAVHTFPVLTETFVLEPIVELIRRGHEVEIIALYPGSPAAHHPAAGEHSLHDRAVFLVGDRPGRGPLRKAWTGAARLPRVARRLPWTRIVRDVTRPGLLRVWPELVLAGIGAAAAALDRQRPLAYDVVHAHMGRAALAMQHLRDWGLLRGPLVATFHGSDVLVEPRRHGRGLYDRLFAGADALTANTEFLLRELRALGAPVEKSVVAPVGVDPGAFEFRPRRLAPGEPLRVLTVARLDPLKGLRYGIEAVHALRRDGVDVVYTIVGEGPQRQELEALVRRLGLEGAVELTGSMTWDRIPDVYARHHVFVLPGTVSPGGGREAQGRVLIEAQASGMPVVATPVGGMPEAVAPGAGRIVAEGDAGAVAEALRELLRESDRWAAMGRLGREYVERRFHGRRLMDDTVALYRQLAAGGVRP